jgi:hypothetical protein
MLNEKNSPNYFWVEAVTTIVYIMNQTLTSTLHGMTLEEKFTSKKPDVSHLKMFGYIAYVSQPHFEGSVRSPLTLPKMGLGSPPRLPKIQSAIVGVKTPRIEAFFILLERS